MFEMFTPGLPSPAKPHPHFNVEDAIASNSRQQLACICYIEEPKAIQSNSWRVAQTQNDSNLSFQLLVRKKWTVRNLWRRNHIRPTRNILFRKVQTFAHKTKPLSDRFSNNVSDSLHLENKFATGKFQNNIGRTLKLPSIEKATTTVCSSTPIPRVVNKTTKKVFNVEIFLDKCYRFTSKWANVSTIQFPPPWVLLVFNFLFWACQVSNR
jgi:hypothetical protein